ncbi:MAG TPA: anthranilate phosphoribosyltransferase [Thermoanaerobaculia bacterium]|nr:anthranilate phosphoribosyltransferase [Thermoanaerobaculia bacterium]
MIEESLKKLIDGENLSREEMHGIFAEMMEGGVSDTQKSALLVALRMKGETAEEITGAAMAMRERVVSLNLDSSGLIDTCGTGGDGCATFNISTVAAIVAAGAGARVAKHGNRAVSSSCGSADVLAALGVNIDLNADEIVEVLNRIGISFLFAPRLHPAMRAVSDVRKALGVRTIFNLLGPLTNPALARRQIVGVYEPNLVRIVAEVLLALGAERAMVVHSRDGMDEISISAPTDVCEVVEGELRSYEVSPESLGLQRYSMETILGGDAAANAAIAKAILRGGEGAMRDVVLANAGAALYVSGSATSLREGVVLAKQSIDSGEALKKLKELIRITNEFAGAAA